MCPGTCIYYFKLGSFTCVRTFHLKVRCWNHLKSCDILCFLFGNSPASGAYKLQTHGNYPKQSIQHTEHGESLKSCDIPFLLRKLNILFCRQTILSLDYILRYFNPVQTFTPDSCELHCNVLSYCFCLPRISILWVFPTDVFIHFISNVLATCPL